MTEPRTVRVVQGGPIMVEGPVRIEMPDGSVMESDRFMVAICACKRSKTYPLCDTSHRQRRRGDADAAESSGQRSA
ncbi:MAG: CDGSH iron-sulfur domain-containing protein [Actinomycetota bacterium]|nr:CDGSH iron-sulfur domain-containing protein [Actinomycetota bacterium]